VGPGDDFGTDTDGSLVLDGFGVPRRPSSPAVESPVELAPVSVSATVPERLLEAESEDDCLREPPPVTTSITPNAPARRSRQPGELRRFVRAFREQPLPFWIALALSLGFGVLFGRLGVRQYEAFGSWAFDLGIYDQALWKASRFDKTFITVRGLEMWGHHFNPVLYLHAPAYWLGAGPRFLYVSQAVCIGLGGVAVYLLGRDRLKSAWLGMFCTVAYLGYAPIGFIAWANWHPEALVITPLLFAWWAARRKSWRMFAVFAGLALTTREDAALVMTMMGLLLIWSTWTDVRTGADPGGFRWSNRNLRNSVFTLFGAVGLYFFATKGVIRHYNDGKDPFYIQYFYGDFGSTMFEVLGNMLRNPDKVVSLGMQKDRLTFYTQLLVPLAGAPLLGFPYLLMAGPQMLSSITSSTPYARMIDYQYPSMMIAPIVIAAVEGLGRRVKSQGSRRWAVAVLLLCTYVSNVAWSNSPLGKKHSYWSAPGSRAPALQKAVDMVPDGVGVSATYALGPHLSHRDDIYDWPNPWINAYWGNELPGNIVDPPPHDPNRVTWVVFDRFHLDVDNPANVRQAELVRRLIGPGGEFEVVFEQDNVVVARRVRPDGGVPAATSPTPTPVVPPAPVGPASSVPVIIPTEPAAVVPPLDSTPISLSDGAETVPDGGQASGVGTPLETVAGESVSADPVVP
jgi:uncharacterized membrane protein